MRSLTVEPDYRFDPANSVQIELSRQIDRQGQDTGHEVELEFKHLFNRLARDGWGWGISAALGAERNAGGSSRSASTNSLRVVMLICLVTLFCSRRTIRRVATYVRQQVSSGSNSDE